MSKVKEKIAIGEHILRGLGACSNSILARKAKDYKWLFKEKTKLTRILRDIKNYDWKEYNFIEESIWKPKYRELLRRSRWIK